MFVSDKSKLKNNCFGPDVAKYYTEERPCQLTDSEYKASEKCKDAAHIQGIDEIETVDMENKTAVVEFWKNKETIVGPKFRFYDDVNELTFPQLRKAGLLKRIRKCPFSDTVFEIFSSMVQKVNFPKLELVTQNMSIYENGRLLEVNFGKIITTNKFSLSYNNKLNDSALDQIYNSVRSGDLYIQKLGGQELIIVLKQIFQNVASIIKTL